LVSKASSTPPINIIFSGNSFVAFIVAFYNAFPCIVSQRYATIKIYGLILHLEFSDEVDTEKAPVY
jgi:hypothetical protein